MSDVPPPPSWPYSRVPASSPFDSPPASSPYGQAPPSSAHDTGPRRPRPGRSGIWLGAVMMLLGVAVLVGGILLVWQPFISSDAVIAADGGQHTVELPAGEERGLFLRSSGPATCTAVDGDGQPVAFRSLRGASYTVNDWEGTDRFDTGSGELTFTCESPVEGAEVRIGPMPGIGGMIGGTFAAIGGALLLGIGGLALLVVTVLRRRSR